MKNVLIIVQIISGALLTFSVLIQSQGAGLGSSFGGGGEFYRSRRGVEKILFRFTIFIIAIFLASSFFAIVV